MPVAANTYRIVLNVDGQEQSQSVRILADPALPARIATADLFRSWEAEETEEEETDFD